MIAVGVGLGLILTILAVTSWRVASQTVHDTEGLVAQAGLLVAVFQAIVAAVVALATIYYARLTREMVEQVAQSAERDRRRETGVVVKDLIGSALDLSMVSGTMASLMRSSWRSVWPSSSRARDGLLMQTQAQASASLRAVVRAADVLRAAYPDRLAEIDALLDASERVFRCSLEGDVDAVTHATRGLRNAADTVRASFGPEVP